MATDLSPRRAAELQSVVTRACEQMDLDPTGAELIKYTVNAVYRLRSAPVVVRIGSGRVGAVRGDRTVTVARWLAARDGPVITLFDGADPIEIDGQFTVTFWHELATSLRWTAADLASPLRELHRIAPDTSLPPWDPFSNAAHRLDEADTVIPHSDLDWLRDQWSEVETQYRACEASLPMGLIHGDPHTGNLLRDTAGKIVLCDLDEAGIGPLAWDLVPQAVGAVRFNRAGFYRDFVNAYGTDVRVQPSWPVLARIRELIMVTSVLPDLGERPGVAAQHAHRLQSLRSGDTTATWSLYT
ncbi:aminoglycoside phosphotransferase family protein [Nocardia amikacinitolerans]|uniref:aminoglycoside phosphotransferase family protein n=1 Tax=Nocardia amikacinitolerans TaxID=756689 RepID=UPI0036C1D586